MKLPPGFAAIRRSLKNRNYRLFTIGYATSLLGSWMQRVAVAWLTWELTGSAAWLGLIAFADLFPAVLFSPFAGAAADRWNRLHITIATEALALVQALALLVLTMTGAINEWWLLWLSFLAGAANAMNQPARFALMPSLVDQADLTPAIALNSMVFNIARFVGPAIAGLIIVSGGVSLAFLANALTYGVFLALLWSLRLSPHTDKRPQEATFRSDLWEGFRYAANHAGVRPLLLLLAVQSICGRSVAELLSAFADRIHGLAAGGLAAFTSALGLGAVVAGLWLGGRQSYAGLTRFHIHSALLLGVAVAVFAVADAAWIAVMALLLAGFAMSAVGVSAQMLIYATVEGQMRGRVLSLYGMIWRAGPALGALLLGVLSDRAGLRLPLFLAACCCIACWFLAFLIRKRLTRALEPAGTSPAE